MGTAATPKVFKSRYQLISPINRGGMGEVWKARDLELSADCAVKIMRDNADARLWELFNREQNVLAELHSPHIVRIYDRGTFDDGGGTRPFFVMPLLTGMSLAEIIAKDRVRITVEWLLDIVRQVCRGLQAAHGRGIFHRDLKPSNILVDDENSATIIDFGVAHLGNTQTSGFRGTLQYTAPELVDIRTTHEPSPASDLYSLAVVMYEALTGQRPFERKSERDTFYAILNYYPPPIWAFNPRVPLSFSKVIHKELAKAPLHRYPVAKEFADNLQKSSRGELLPEFDESRIASRIEAAHRAFAGADYQTCQAYLLELQNEGEIDDRIVALREQVDNVLRQKTISQLLESARTLIAQGDPMAVTKVQEVLLIDPQNGQARELLSEIKRKKSQRDIENWFELAKRHLEAHDFKAAREALQEILAIRPESQAFAMLADLDRRERDYDAVCAEKERLFQEAKRAYDSGQVTTALSKLGQILGMIRAHGGGVTAERDASYQEFYNQIHSEHEKISRDHSEARKAMADGDFTRTSQICRQYPQNPVFQGLQLEAQEVHRQQRSAYLAETSLRVESESDLDKRVAILEEAAGRYPGDPQFEDRLAIARERRDRIQSIVEEAHKLEESGDFNGAFVRWEVLRKVYPRYPGLSFEIERLSRRRDSAARTETLARWQEQIDRCLQAEDCERALYLCQNALREFPEEQSLNDRLTAARRGIEVASSAQSLIAQAEAWIQQGRDDEGLKALREILEMPVRSSLVRVHLVDLLAREALLLIDKDWRTAEYLVNEALKLDSAHAPSRSLLPILDDHRRSEFVAECVSKARLLEAQGDVRSAFEAARSAVDTYPKSAPLIQLLREIQAKLIATVRPGALAELTRLLEAAKIERQKLKMRELVESARATAASYPGDAEMLQIVSQIEECERQLNRPFVDRAKASAIALAGQVSRFSRARWEEFRGRVWPVVIHAAGSAWRSRSSLVTLRLGSRKLTIAAQWIAVAVLGVIVLTSALVWSLRARRTVSAGPAVAKVAPPPVSVTPEGGTDKKVGTEGGHQADLRPLKVQFITNVTTVTAYLDQNAFESTHIMELPSAADPAAVHTFSIHNGPSKVSFDFTYDPASWPATINQPKDKKATVFAVGIFRGVLRAQVSIPTPIFVQNRGYPIEVPGPPLELPLPEEPVFLRLTDGGERIPIQPRGDPTLILGVFWQDAGTAGNVNSLMNQAQSLIDKGSYRRAEEIIDGVLGRDSGNERAKRLKHKLQMIKSVAPW